MRMLAKDGSSIRRVRAIKSQVRRVLLEETPGMVERTSRASRSIFDCFLGLLRLEVEGVVMGRDLACRRVI